MLQADFATPTLYGAFIKNFLTENGVVTAKARGKKTLRTTKPRLILRGAASAPLGLERVEIKVGKARWKPARGLTTWRFVVRGLRPGNNRAMIRASDIAGTLSPTQKLLVLRK